MSASEEFREAIAAAGITPPSEIIPYRGKIERFSSNGKARDDSGWYVFHDDERPAGRFGDYRSGVDATWTGKSEPWTPEQKREWAKTMRALEEQRQRDQEELHKRAADKAAKMWDAAHDATERQHDYLSRKHIPGVGARMLREMLLVPLYHGPRQLVGLQIIQQDGARKFLTGTPSAGAYTVIGKPSKTGHIVICEGYATAVSVHIATGYCVVVAFSAGNLEAVAKKIRAAMPEAIIFIGADDDCWLDDRVDEWAAENNIESYEVAEKFDPFGIRYLEVTHGGRVKLFKNAGRVAAAVTARAIGAHIALPVWDGEREKGTDFNDLHLAEGLQAVADCFELPEPPAADPEPEPTIEHNEIAEQTGSNVPSVPASTRSDTDYTSWLVDVTDKGKPLSTIGNLAEITRRLGVIVRYNVISKDEEILIPGLGFSMDNRQNAAVAWITSEAAKFRMPTGNIGDYVTYLAERNQWNPVASWITSKAWDGHDRLSELIATVHATGETTSENVRTMKRAFLTRWMLSAVAGAFRPHGVSAHGVLVFQGDQYLGKTKWFKSLVPEELAVLQDGVILRPEDRDSVKQCVSNWLVELGELDATFRKSDIAALKAFLTRDKDVFRRAYARKESEFARRTIFFASVNPKEFLHDPTGNRRYWTIECEALDHSHTIDMQQCWAQVYALYCQGEGWFLTADEMEALNSHNKDFEVIDPIEELIRNRLLWGSDEWDWEWRSATEILTSLGRDTCTQSEATRAAHVIRACNGKRSRKANGVRQLLTPKKNPSY
jgi:putative DNA primase/helicase